MRNPVLLLTLAAGLALPAAAAGSGAPPVFLNCEASSPAQLPAPWLPSQRPATCNLTGQSANEGDVAIVRHARWSGWGTASATGSGQVVNPGSGAGVPAAVAVRIELSQLQPGCHGRLYYTRARVTTRYGTGTTRLSAACNQAAPSLGATVLVAG
jgi:hypothetical protein